MKGYYEIAIDDLSYLEGNLNTNIYNSVAVAEKMLKSVLELVSVECVNPLQSHNLYTINSYILRSGVDLNLNEDELSTLKDMYFNAKYPSKDFIEVSERQAAKFLNTMYDVVQAVNTYRKENDLPYINVIRKSIGSSTQSVFDAYRNKFHITNDDAWFSEMARLSKLFGTSNIDNIAKEIKNMFL